MIPIEEYRRAMDSIAAMTGRTPPAGELLPAVPSLLDPSTWSLRLDDPDLEASIARCTDRRLLASLGDRAEKRGLRRIVDLADERRRGLPMTTRGIPRVRLP
jgi:hypothetical protein